jgi:bifunctional DNA-binding transcriptional regulator/antitoxin component of YhaV-PrlF toxin-antitoxin module
MKASKITSNGRVTISADLRKKYCLTPGACVNLIEEKEGIKIIPVTHETIHANVGFLGIKGKSLLKALMEDKKIEQEL